MTQLFQIQNIDKTEFISIVESAIENKLLKLKEKGQQQTYSVSEVSKLLSVSEITVYNYIKKGLIKSYKVGRKHMINRLELEEAIKEVKSLKYKRDVK